jgi:hypothetical protein
MVYKHPDSLETQHHSNMEAYCKLFRKVYGINQNYTPIKREILSIGDSVFRVALLTCQASFSGARGQLYLAMDITQKDKPRFVAMDFTPYDYSEVPFFANISGLSLEYIKAKNITAFKNDISKDFQERIVNGKKMENSLVSLNCDSMKQFTSSLRLRGNSIIARVIYELPKENKYMALDYIREDNRFKLHDLGFIQKASK